MKLLMLVNCVLVLVNGCQQPRLHCSTDKN